MTDGKDDPDDLKRRNQQLAKELLESMNRPVSPERTAYEAEKEAADKAALEAYYQRTGQKPDPTARARTTTEMLFAASLEPCPHCRTLEPAQLDLFGSGTSWSVTGPCPRCKQTRSYGWATEGNPNDGACPPRQLGDARPSMIIRPGQFIAELDRLLPKVRTEPAQLEPVEWRASLAAIDRAITCLYELLKFVPANTQLIPDTKLTPDERKDRASRRERYQKAWLQAELARLLALTAKYGDDAERIWALEKRGRTVAPARGAVDRAALTAHEAWVRAGRQGPGRLEVVGYDARGLRLAGVQFQGARLERVNLDKALLEAARMTECELRDVSAREANATSIQLMRSTLTGGTFARSALALATFDDATIDETSFEDANLDRSQWRGAKVTAANFDLVSFGNTRFDAARFRGCTFKKADFRPLTEGIKATTAGAVFEDCDLRATKWQGRDLSGATFVRCKLAGVTGRPSSIANVTIEAPDLSPEGDGSDVGDAEDVLELWQRGGN